MDRRALPVASENPSDLTAIAVESLLDGCLGEVIAAELARQGVARASDPVVADTLAMLGDDEARHAELGWDVVAFCVERGGDEVSRELAAAWAAAPVRATAGPVELKRAEVAAIARAQARCVEQRLAALVAPVACAA